MSQKRIHVMVLKVPSSPFSFSQKAYRTEPLLNSGYFQVNYYKINYNVWSSLCLLLAISVFQIIHLFGVKRIIKKEFDLSNNILPSDKSLNVAN